MHLGGLICTHKFPIGCYHHRKKPEGKLGQWSQVGSEIVKSNYKKVYVRNES